MDISKSLFLDDPAAKFGELELDGAAVLYASEKGTAEPGIRRKLVRSDADYHFLQEGHEIGIEEGGYLDVTDPDALRALTDEDVAEDFIVHDRKCAPGRDPVMFMNIYNGADAPDMPGFEMIEAASIPVAVEFGKDQLFGNVRSLRNVRFEAVASVLSTPDASGACDTGCVAYAAGDKFLSSRYELSARPLPGFDEYLDAYAGNLALPRGKEKQVPQSAVEKVEAVMAARTGNYDMSGTDFDRLHRYMAYGDDAPPVTKWEAMHDIGGILNVQSGKHVLDAGFVKACEQAVHGYELELDASETGPDGRELSDTEYAAEEQRIIDDRNAAAERAGQYLAGTFSAFAADHPSDKQGFAKALAGQWAGLDAAFCGSTAPHSGATELLVMQVACDQMGYDLVPDKNDAHALDGFLNDIRSGGDPKDFSDMLERSLSEHPQPQAEKGYPDRDRPFGAYARLQAMADRRDRDEAGRSADYGLEM